MQVYLARDGAAILDASGELWSCATTDFSVTMAELAGALARTRGSRQARVWLGASLCRPVRLPPVAGDASARERERIARALATSDSGLLPPCRVDIDRSRGAAELAVVVEEAVLAAIDREFAAAGVRAVSVRPWWAAMLTDALEETPALRAFAVWEGRALTILAGAGRDFSAAQTLYPVDEPGAASAAFARSLVSAMIPAADAVALRLDWPMPGSPQARSPLDAGAAPFACCVHPLEAGS